MQITKGADLIRGRRFFEARRLLEEIRYLHYNGQKVLSIITITKDYVLQKCFFNRIKQI